MGTTGAGKTTIGSLLASRIGWRFADADDFHPESNIRKMKAGHPLDDADRRPWLASMRDAIEGWLASGDDTVLACSALKRKYRDVLRAGEGVTFVYLKGTYEQIEDRLESRTGHFAKVDLLASQFETLEEPEADEPSISVPVSATPEEAVEQIVQRLQLVRQ